MNDKIHKALGIFLDAIRPFIISFLQQRFPNEPWEGRYFSILKPKRQETWNQGLRSQGENASCAVLIDYNNLTDFAIAYKRELGLEFGSSDRTNSFISYLQELKNIRNKCSHFTPLDEDEVEGAYLYMKQAAKLMKMDELVEEINKVKVQTIAPIVAPTTAPATPVTTQVPMSEDTPIPAWFTNVYPHYDIRNGSLDESVFAANLSEVALGVGPEVYSNPTSFFEKTYITTGLRDIANRVIRALNGEESENRVISLQTGFGGGKTHTLISLYHIAKAGKSLFDSAYTTHILQDGVTPTFDKAKVAVFTNNTNDVEQGRITDEGITIYTLWGELAYQLGGIEAYNQIKANDEKRIAPTSSIFKPILSANHPSLILIDELADYCNKANGYAVGNGTLYTQTLSFIQTLTESVAAIPQCVLIATLPASATEVASSEIGQQILSSLENRIVRVGSGIKPVEDEEIFEVVRRRLFENIGDTTVIEQVLTRYKNTYHNRYRDLPPEANRTEYINKMRKSYPFHPELIDMFRLKWGNDSRFQRTRGVLRLLASIVKDLWARRGSLTGSQALIHTSDVNLSNLPTLTGTITSLMGSQWETVMHADIIGTSSNAYKIDNEDPNSNISKYKLAEGIATTLLMSSVGGAQNKGMNIEQLKLCLLRPVAFQHSEINNALNKLEQVAYYLYSTNIGTRSYWFQAKPNVNILINSAKSEISLPEVNTEILKRLNSQTNSNSQLKVLINPSNDIPEQKSLTLIILEPEYATQSHNVSKKVQNYVEQIATQKGNSPRVFRNTIFYLTCSENQLGLLQSKLIEYLACERVLTEYKGQLDTDQRQDVTNKRNVATAEADQQLISVYNIAMRYSATDGLETIEIREFAKNMQSQLTEKLLELIKEEEWLIGSIGIGTLKSNGLYPTIDNPVNVTALYEAFLQYDDKPMISGPDAVVSSIQKYCSNGEFNVAFGEKGNYSRIYHKENIWGLNVSDNQFWLVDKSVMLEEPSTPTPQPANNSGEDNGNEQTKNDNDPNVPSMPSVRHFKSIRISGKIPWDQWTQLFTSFVVPLSQNNLDIEVSFKAKSTGTKPLDESAQIYKVVKESAQQLGLKLEEEE